MPRCVVGSSNDWISSTDRLASLHESSCSPRRIENQSQCGPHGNHQTGALEPSTVPGHCSSMGDRRIEII